ncbi:MAG: hypothetical protein P4L57_03835 [Rhizomicrobium sp.]|nr:hypothetical protein [Rhizomicrobium sp.]
MFWNLTTLILTAVAAAAFYWLGPKFVAAFKRFDEENRSRILDERRDRGDGSAHVRHTLKVAEEQVEEIVEVRESDPRTGTPVIRFAFEGEVFATRAEAERVRAIKIGEIARGFYRELPAALAAKRHGERLN